MSDTDNRLLRRGGWRLMGEAALASRGWVIIGIACSRPDSSKRVLSKLSRRRLKMPPEERYRADRIHRNGW